MDWFDRSIVQYVLTWGPYGSMHDEDTFPAFGMRVDQLTEWFTRLISGYGSTIAASTTPTENCWRARSYHLRTRPFREVDPSGSVRLDGPSTHRRRRPSVASQRALRMAGAAARAAAAQRARDVG